MLCFCSVFLPKVAPEKLCLIFFCSVFIISDTAYLLSLQSTFSKMTIEIVWNRSVLEEEVRNRTKFENRRVLVPLQEQGAGESGAGGRSVRSRGQESREQEQEQKQDRAGISYLCMQLLSVAASLLDHLGLGPVRQGDHTGGEGCCDHWLMVSL